MPSQVARSAPSFTISHHYSSTLPTPHTSLAAEKSFCPQKAQQNWGGLKSLLSDFTYSVALTNAGREEVEMQIGSGWPTCYWDLLIVKRQANPSRELEGKRITNKQYAQLRYNSHSLKWKTIQTGQEEILSKDEISLILPKNRTSIRASMAKSVENHKQRTSLPWPQGQAVITK